MMPRFITRELGVVLLIVLTMSHLEATPPTQEWTIYEHMAKTQGIEKVRPLYKRIIAWDEPRLNATATLTPGDDLAVRRRKLPCEAIFLIANSWVQSERRALSKSGPVHPGFEKEVWRPMLSAVRSAVRQYDLLVNDLNTAEAQAPPEQRTEYTQMKNLAGSTPYHRDKCLYSLAHLAKANRPDWVREVFVLGQGRIATFDSADDFLKTDSDPEPETTRNKKILADAIAKGKANPPPKRFPVTDDEKKAIRGLLDQWVEAVVARDADKMQTLYEDPKLFGSLYADQVAHSPYSVYDLTSATVTYTRDHKDGPVSIRVEYATAKTRATPGSETKQYTLGRDFLVVFRHGQPKLVIKGDMK